MDSILKATGLRHLLGALKDRMDSREAALKKELLLAAHPVGSYYWSSDPTSPEILFGGKWERIKEKFVFALGDHYKTVGETGGAASVTSGGHYIQLEELPGTVVAASRNNDTVAHNYDFFSIMQSAQVAAQKWIASSISTIVNGKGTLQTNNPNQSGSTPMGSVTGSSQPHTHTVDTMPPYIVANCWRRTA